MRGGSLAFGPMAAAPPPSDRLRFLADPNEPDLLEAIERVGEGALDRYTRDERERESSSLQAPWRQGGLAAGDRRHLFVALVVVGVTVGAIRAPDTS